MGGYESEHGLDECCAPGGRGVQCSVGRVRGPVSLRSVSSRWDRVAQLSSDLAAHRHLQCRVLCRPIDPLPLSFGLTIFTSDLIWWVPCTLMLLRSYQDGPAKETST